MKFLFVLLACIAATNAASYYFPNQGMYTYSYYCRHQFNVYIPSSCYRYTVYFPSTWCSSSYYSNILKVYPSEDCSERSVTDIANEVRGILASQRSSMCGKMYAARDSYLRKLDYIIALFNGWYKTYLYRWYSYNYCYLGYTITGYYVVRDRRVTEYCQKLADMRARVSKQYNDAISTKITFLNTYHEKLVKAVTDCLNTRLSKIAEYRTALDKKISDYVSKFSSLHYSLALKNRDYYRNVLRTLFDGGLNWWTGWKTDVTVSYYYGRQRSKVYYLIRDYRNKLYSFRSKLISYYTCAYKCYLNTGSLSFAKKSYYTHCKSIGQWYCYKSSYCMERYCLAPFKVKFTPCQYKTLKTCDVDAAAGSISGLISSLESQRDATLRDNSSKFNSWRSTWVNNFYKYKAAFWRIVIDRHNFLCAYQRYQYISLCGYISVVQTSYLSKMKNDLITRANRACSEYYQQLLTNLRNADKAHGETQQKFKDAFNNLISQLKSKFEACKSTRTTKIAEYKKKLEASRNAQRTALGKKMYEAKNAHWSKFHAMLRHYNGSCYYKYAWISWMTSCYASHLIGKCNRVYYEFDSFWRSMIPRLVQHYACCYKCTVNAKVVPKYSCGYWYSWKYCLPTYSSYSYRYNYWYKYHTCIVY